MGEKKTVMQRKKPQETKIQMMAAFFQRIVAKARFPRCLWKAVCTGGYTTGDISFIKVYGNNPINGYDSNHEFNVIHI